MNLSSFSMKVLATSLVLASTTGLAFAKNYKGEANYKGEVAVPCPPPKLLMAGWYLGAQVGYDSYRVRSEVEDDLGLLAADPVINATGWMGGLYLGWGTYLNEWFYLGAEVNGNLSGAKQEYDVTTPAFVAYENEFKARGSWGVSLLPGFRLNDATLGYVRLGWNWARLKGEQEFFGLIENSTTHTSNGFVFGVGLETLLVDNWSLRAEYDHTYYSNFDSENRAFFNNALFGFGPSAEWKPSDNQFTMGVSYHFG